MRAGKYFEAPAEQYAKAIQYHLDRMAKELGRPFPAGSGKKGSGGSIVVALLVASAILWFRWRA
jgi:hypothetical protein